MELLLSRMSALGQKQTCVPAMSALPPKADMCSAHTHVCFGPKADMGHIFRDGVRWLTRSRLLLRLAFESQSPQLLSAIAKSLLRCIIICGCLCSVSFLILARFKDPLSADAVCVFMLGHAD